MRKTMQQIEDGYTKLGFRGQKLRQALEIDKEYQGLLKQRKKRLTRYYKINDLEKTQYVLSTDTDFEILEKCKRLEKLNLDSKDRKLVKLIKTQLENDWRNPLVRTLNQLIEKYSN